MADKGRELNDKELARLERELAREYANAKKEMIEKFNRTSKQFKALDLQKQKLVEKNKMSEAEYEKWKKSQLLNSKWMKSMIDQYSTDMVKIDKKAAEIINSKLPKMYAESFNHGTYEIENGTGISTSFTLYNKSTVTRLLRDKPDLYDEASINVPKDKRWNQQAMRSALTQGVLQGEGMDGIAKRLASVTDMDRSSAIRNARTLTTGAEASGKLDSYFRARDMGIPIKKMWESTVDDRTRASHRNLDGETRELEEKFSNGLMYPGDTSTGEGAEFYNCRCNLSSQIEGFETDMTDMSQRRNKLGDMSYDEWKKANKKKYSNPMEEELNRRRKEILELPPNRQALELYRNGYLSQEDALKFAKDGTISEYVNRYYDEAIGNLKINEGRAIVEGKDLSGSWTRRSNEFEFVIEDVLNAQGFDGLPRIVDADEFDKLVKEANNGNGFIAQRTYSAPSKEILDEYRNQLYNGKWYVDCSEGGAQYGQGMYCAADYTGKLSNGIKSEMAHYQNLAVYKANSAPISFGGQTFYKSTGTDNEVFSYTETMTLASDAKIITYNKLKEMYNQEKYDMLERLTEEEYMEWSASKVGDLGAYAALKGYDAINAEGHGSSGSYTVVLNRTKVIIRREY